MSELSNPLYALNTLDASLLLSILSEKPSLIKYIKNPSEELCIKCIEKDPSVIGEIFNPTIAICRRAFELDQRILQYVKGDSIYNTQEYKKLCLEALKTVPISYLNISYFSEEEQLELEKFALGTRCTNISGIRSPKEEHYIIVAKYWPNVITYYINKVYPDVDNKFLHKLSLIILENDKLDLGPIELGNLEKYLDPVDYKEFTLTLLSRNNSGKYWGSFSRNFFTEELILKLVEIMDINTLLYKLKTYDIPIYDEVWYKIFDKMPTNYVIRELPTNLYTKEICMKILQHDINYCSWIPTNLMSDEDIMDYICENYEKITCKIPLPKEVINHCLNKRPMFISKISPGSIDQFQALDTFYKDKGTFQYIPNCFITPEMVNDAILHDPENIKYVHKTLHNENIYEIVIAKNPNLIQFLSNPSKKLCLIAIKHNFLNVKYIPVDFLEDFLINNITVLIDGEPTYRLLSIENVETGTVTNRIIFDDISSVVSTEHPSIPFVKEDEWASVEGSYIYKIGDTFEVCSNKKTKINDENGSYFGTLSTRCVLQRYYVQ